VLTVLGSGLYGMNTRGMPWINSQHGSEIAIALTVVSTVGLLITLKKLDWF